MNDLSIADDAADEIERLRLEVVEAEKRGRDVVRPFD